MQTNVNIAPHAAAEASPRPIQWLGWAVLFTIWFNLGLFVLLNSVVLRDIIATNDTITLPTSTQDAVWLVVVMWLVGYVSAFIVGLCWEAPRRDLIGSSVLGYLIAATLHLALLGVFPGTPINSFNVLRSIVSLEPLPIYYIFVFLSLILGPVVAGLATYTGTLVAGEMYALRLPARTSVDPAAVIFATLLPVAAMLMAIGILNVRDLDEQKAVTRDYQIIINQFNENVPFNEQEPVPSVVFLHLNSMTSLLNYIGLALIVGLLIGIKRVIRSPWQAGLSAMLGFGVSMLLAFLLLDLIEPDTTPNVNYTDIYTDELGTVRAPNVSTFAQFWFIPPLVAGATAFGLHLLLNNVAAGATRLADVRRN